MNILKINIFVNIFYWYINVYGFIVIIEIEEFMFINILLCYRWIYYSSYNSKSSEYCYSNNINSR